MYGEAGNQGDGLINGAELTAEGNLVPSQLATNIDSRGRSIPAWSSPTALAELPLERLSDPQIPLTRENNKVGPVCQFIQHLKEGFQSPPRKSQEHNTTAVVFRHNNFLASSNVRAVRNVQIDRSNTARTLRSSSSLPLTRRTRYYQRAVRASSSTAWSFSLIQLDRARE